MPFSYDSSEKAPDGSTVYHGVSVVNIEGFGIRIGTLSIKGKVKAEDPASREPQPEPSGERGEEQDKGAKTGSEIFMQPLLKRETLESIGENPIMISAYNEMALDKFRIEGHELKGVEELAGVIEHLSDRRFYEPRFYDTYDLRFNPYKEEDVRMETRDFEATRDERTEQDRWHLLERKENSNTGQFSAKFEKQSDNGNVEVSLSKKSNKNKYGVSVEYKNGPTHIKLELRSEDPNKIYREQNLGVDGAEHQLTDGDIEAISGQIRDLHHAMMDKRDEIAGKKVEELRKPSDDEIEGLREKFDIKLPIVLGKEVVTGNKSLVRIGDRGFTVAWNTAEAWLPEAWDSKRNFPITERFKPELQEIYLKYHRDNRAILTSDEIADLRAIGADELAEVVEKLRASETPGMQVSYKEKGDNNVYARYIAGQSLEFEMM